MANLPLMLNPEPLFFMDDINDLDLTLVKLKLHSQQDGIGWKFKQCKQVEVEYKRFLALKRHYPDRLIIPGKNVDLFWHQHILDTEKYAKDCEAIFGYFLHHKPYYGMHSEQWKAAYTEGYEETCELYKLHFGDMDSQ